MATRTIEVKQCDVCGSEDGVQTFEVSSPLGTATVELCTKHAGPVEKVMTAGRLRRRPGRKPATKSSAAAKSTGGSRSRARRGSGSTATGSARKSTRRSSTRRSSAATEETPEQA